MFAELNPFPWQNLIGTLISFLIGWLMPSPLGSKDKEK